MYTLTPGCNPLDKEPSEINSPFHNKFPLDQKKIFKNNPLDPFLKIHFLQLQKHHIAWNLENVFTIPQVSLYERISSFYLFLDFWKKKTK